MVRAVNYVFSLGTEHEAPRQGPFTVTSPGEVAGNAAALGGRIEVRTRASAAYRIPGQQVQQDDGYTITYGGSRASDTRFLQFAWRRIVPHPRRAGEPALMGDFSSYGGTYPLTVDENRPVWHVDTSDDRHPYYAGVTRSGDRVTMWDRPEGGEPHIRANWQPETRGMTSVMRIETYVLQGMDVVYKVTQHYRWEYDGRPSCDGVPAVEHTVDGAGACSGISRDQKAQLDREYRGWFTWVPEAH